MRISAYPMMLASVSIILWATLATLGQELAQVPPFLLVGLALGIGSIPSLKDFRSWFQRLDVLALGTAGIFGYHFMLFLALRKAPALEANLLNYTWPILMIILSPVFLVNSSFRVRHIVGGIIAFAGAAVVICQRPVDFNQNAVFGYLLALGAALIWALYSIATKKMSNVPSSAVGGFCFFSSILALICHYFFEERTAIRPKDWLLIITIGLGPLGLAFYTWDAAIKGGDPKRIGALSYATPLLSTFLLAARSDQNSLTQANFLALILIVCGAALSAW
jgi:drug/metabolite transporter (DMT)-like permease